jgi:NitT/TauT family transport system ATP-binding protein
MINIRKLSFWYNNRKILSNISFNIKKGEYLTLLGKSGCGKTTLANILAGYLDLKVGTVTIDGKTISKPGKNRIVVNQEYDLFDWLTVWQNMNLVSKHTDKIKYYLSLVDLLQFKNFYPSRLSVGMKKRLSLARALIVEPNFLILDEPFESLDYRTKESIQFELSKIHHKTRRTILHISHNIEESIYLSDRIILFGNSPTTIVKEFTINFSRPRSPKIKTSDKYRNYRKSIADSYI